MKRTFLLATLLLGAAATFAADDVNESFKHMSANVGLGSTGITLDVGTMAHPLVGLRLGFDYMPSITMKKFDLSVSDGTGNAKDEYERLQPQGLKKPGNVLVGAAPGWFTGHLLADFYLHRDKGFHFTAGLYFTGSDHFMTMKNKEKGWFNDIYDFNNSLGPYADVDHNTVGHIGITLKDGTILGPDKKGDMYGKFEVWKVRPYIGVGYGRTVSEKRIDWAVDAGIQIWGTPKAYIKDSKAVENTGAVYHEVFASDLSDPKAHDAVKRAKTFLKVYPCVTFRLNCRLF